MKQTGRKENEKRGQKCCGFIASAIHLSSPDDAAPEMESGRSARSMMQPAPQAQARRSGVLRSAGEMPELLEIRAH